jgi:tRNA (guanine37-N1)-methyltransferase
MEKEQWTVRVPRKEGEGMRQRLLLGGVLDQGLKPRTEGDDLLLPVTEAQPERACFEVREPLPDLPRHELIGDIAVMLEEDPEAAREILRLRPGIHTVLFPEGDVEGEFRTRRFAVLAGAPTTATTHREFGNRFAIDLSVAYFSARLATERQRVLSLTGQGERVLDMFAGVGPFAITLSPRAELAVAVDLNPGAVRLLQKNIALNRAHNILPFFADAAVLPDLLGRMFDRVIMNHPLGSLSFLPQAFALCRSGGSIHCYLIESEEGQAMADIRKFPVREVSERYVRSYAPGRWHAVYDIVVT